MMPDRILFVDDDLSLLEIFQRLSSDRFTVETAMNGDQGLIALSRPGRYALVVSDFRMPGMDGLQFLSRVRELSPESVRILFTGYADLQIAIDAVNRCNIFRLLTKPCSMEILLNVLHEGLKQYHLILAERELLEKTLQGSIKVLIEILSLVNPEAFSRAIRAAREAREIGAIMAISETWPLETAALLSQIGCVILPKETLGKISQGQSLNPEETQAFKMHPMTASGLLEKIPRLEKIAEIIAYQEKNFDGSGVPNDSRQREEIPLEARILKVALDYDALREAGHSKENALAQLRRRNNYYDPQVLAALDLLIGTEARYDNRALVLEDLKENMILTETVRDSNGTVLVVGGQELSRTLIAHLQNVALTRGVREPIRVVVPMKRK